MHGTSSDGLFTRETRAVPENGRCVVSDGAALGKEKLVAPYVETDFRLDITELIHILDSRPHHAFVGHSYDRARDRMSRGCAVRLAGAASTKD